MLNFQGIGRLALGQLGPVNYAAAVVESGQFSDLYTYGRPFFGELSDTLIVADSYRSRSDFVAIDEEAISGIFPTPPQPYSVKSFFGFDALGVLALGQLDSIQYTQPGTTFDYDQYSCSATISTAVVENPQVASTNHQAMWGFEALGLSALGQADNTRYTQQFSIFDTEDAGRDFLVYVSEALQTGSISGDPSPMFSHEALGRLALGQAGITTIIGGSTFIDTEAAFKIAAPANLNNLWWNNVRFKQNDYPIYKNTRTDVPPAVPPIAWVPPLPKNFFVSLSDGLIFDDGYQSFQGGNPGGMFGFAPIGFPALGQLFIENSPPEPRDQYVDVMESAPLTDSFPGNMFGFQALGGVAVGQAVDSTSYLSAT